jgi:hypothetical protein
MVCRERHRRSALSDMRKSRDETFRRRVFIRCTGVSVRSRECITRDLRSNPVLMECEVRDE